MLVLLLAGGHAVADYGMQSAYMAENKVPVIRRARPGGLVNETPNPDWFVTLGAHCLIHALAVGVVAFAFVALAGRDALPVAAALGWAEFACHFAIDRSKGLGRFSYRTDQALHYGCKLAWAVLILAVSTSS